jgi:hypothetical protein
MILGYGIIAVPTGIFSAELLQAVRRERKRGTKPARHAGGRITTSTPNTAALRRAAVIRNRSPL